MSSMEEDHAADYEAQRRIDDLRREIDAFLRERQRGVSGKTLMALADAAAELELDSERIVRRWD